MNHLYIPKTNRTIYMPSDLSECDYRQYIEMSALILQFQCGELTYEDFRVHAVYKLLDMKRGTPCLDDDFKFSNIHQLSLLIDSFFEVDGDGNKVIKQYYIDNPVERFRGALSFYYGPSNEFNNVKFGEYTDALSHFADFNTTGELKYLYLLLATFYRQRKVSTWLSRYLDKFDGDVRVKYNVFSVNARAKKFHKQHIGIVYGFYLLFASFQKYLSTAKIFIEGREIDLAVLFSDQAEPNQKESDLPGLGMKSLMYAFSESNVFGSLNEVREVPLWEVFIRMYDLNKKSKDYEANISK